MADEELLALARRALQGDAASLLETLRTLVRYEPRRAALPGFEAPLWGHLVASPHQRASLDLCVPVNEGFRGLQWASGFSVVPDSGLARSAYDDFRDHSTVTMTLMLSGRSILWPMRLVTRPDRRSTDVAVPVLVFDDPFPLPRATGVRIQVENGASNHVGFVAVLHGTNEPDATAEQVRDALARFAQPDPPEVPEESGVIFDDGPGIILGPDITE